MYARHQPARNVVTVYHLQCILSKVNIAEFSGYLMVHFILHKIINISTGISSQTLNIKYSFHIVSHFLSFKG